MNYIGIGKDSDNLTDCIALTDICEEFIAKACALGCTFNYARNIYERDGRRNYPF
jgi:hypothetical protein